MGREAKVNLRLVSGIKGYFAAADKTRAVLGLSGGVDSALTLALASKALGAKNVTAILMPESGVTPRKSTLLARGVANQFGVPSLTQPISTFLAPFENLVWAQNKIARTNLRARIRAIMLYNYANSKNALVLGTSNKSELLLGYFTKYGDSAADLLVLGGLYKTEVLDLARFNGLPEEIVMRPPSAELCAGQTDKKELGADYLKIDLILKSRRGGKPPVGIGKGRIKNVLERVEKNEHKRAMPPILLA